MKNNKNTMILHKLVNRKIILCTVENLKAAAIFCVWIRALRAHSIPRRPPLRIRTGKHKSIWKKREDVKVIFERLLSFRKC